MTNFKATFYGAGGSCPYNNGSRAKYGTNSMCVGVTAGGQSLLFDMGTGAASYKSGASSTHVFFSHYHDDHVCGLLFCAPLFDAGRRFSFFGTQDVRRVLDEYLSTPTYPVGLGAFRANPEYINIAAGDVLSLPEGIKVSTIALSHPGGAVGYRVEYAGKSFVYCLDVELTNHKDDRELLDFTRGADLLVMDAYYNDENLMPGWGHSTWRQCAEWAAAAGAKQLALAHHNYRMTDAQLDTYEAEAKKIFPAAFAAADFMQVEI
jgi:phosphoribosyl 1,2-cyclic phosphodiesterase